MANKKKLEDILKKLWKSDSEVNSEAYNMALQDVQTTIDLMSMDEPLSKETEKAIDDFSSKVVDGLMLDLKKDCIIKEFENVLAKEWKEYNDSAAATVDALEDNTQELAFAKGFYRGWFYKEKPTLNWKDLIEKLSEDVPSTAWHESDEIPDPEYTALILAKYKGSGCWVMNEYRMLYASFQEHRFEKWAYVEELSKL